jgi:hypothetical protein
MERQCLMSLHTTAPTKKLAAMTIVTTDGGRRRTTLGTVTASSPSPLPIQGIIKIFVANRDKSLEWVILYAGHG